MLIAIIVYRSCPGSAEGIIKRVCVCGGGGGGGISVLICQQLSCNLRYFFLHACIYVEVINRNVNARTDIHVSQMHNNIDRASYTSMYQNVNSEPSQRHIAMPES